MICAWPGCAAEEGVHAFISLDDGATWWCLIHADDDFLPSITTRGGLRNCARCHDMSAGKLADDTPMHDWCLREWAMAKAVGDENRKGAYGRKAGGRSDHVVVDLATARMARQNRERADDR